MGAAGLNLTPAVVRVGWVEATHLSGGQRTAPEPTL